jgi:hypothetical protein
MCLNVLSMYLNVSILYFNVFNDIVIGIFPSPSYFNVYAMHLHICFSVSTMTPFPICSTTAFSYHAPLCSIITFTQSIKLLHIIFYSLHLCIFPHSSFHFVIGRAEHNKAQVFFKKILEVAMWQSLPKGQRVEYQKICLFYS